MTAQQQAYVSLLAGLVGVLMPVVAPLAWWMGARAGGALDAGASRGARVAARVGRLLGMGVSCLVAFLAAVWLLLSVALAASA